MKIVLSCVFCLFLSVAALAQQNRLAEDFTATSLQGRTVNLEEQKGKVVVLTFWSTRCAICHSEIPKLNKLAEKYAGANVAFMGLTMENETLVQAYLNKKPFKFVIYPNSLGVVIKYSPRDSQGRFNMGYPAFVVIDQQGRIVLNESGRSKTDRLDATIARLLGSTMAKAE